MLPRHWENQSLTTADELQGNSEFTHWTLGRKKLQATAQRDSFNFDPICSWPFWALPMINIFAWEISSYYTYCMQINYCKIANYQTVMRNDLADSSKRINKKEWFFCNSQNDSFKPLCKRFDQFTKNNQLRNNSFAIHKTICSDCFANRFDWFRPIFDSPKNHLDHFDPIWAVN